MNNKSINLAAKVLSPVIAYYLVLGYSSYGLKILNLGLDVYPYIFAFFVSLIFFFVASEDIKERKVNRQATYGLLTLAVIVNLVFLTVNTVGLGEKFFIWSGEVPFYPISNMIAGATVFCFLGALHIITKKKSIAIGDVIIATSLSLFLGVSQTLIMIMLSVLLSLAYVLFRYIKVKRVVKKIPYVAFLVYAAHLALLMLVIF